MAKRGFVKVDLELKKRQTEVPIFTSAAIANAFERLFEDVTLYEGVKRTQLLEAIYEQGRKDGARITFEAIDSAVRSLRTTIPHQNPGRKRKSKTPKKKSSKGRKR